MALPEAPSAAEMVRFLRANHPRHDKLELSPEDYDAITECWSAKDRRQVLQAAKSNKSITKLSIDVMDFTSNSTTTNFITSMVGKLSQVKKVDIFDSGGLDEGEPAPPAMVDKLLAAIANGPSKIMERLEICHPCSPQAFLDFVDKFPNLERFEYEDRYETNDDGEVEDEANRRLPFLMAIATAVSRLLLSLRHVGFVFECNHPGIPCLLSALQAAGPNVQTVDLVFLGGEVANWDDALLQVAFLCAGTRTTQRVILQGENSSPEGMVDMSALFWVNPTPLPFSPSLTEMHFIHCSFEFEDDVDDDYKSITARAAKALQNVESLRFDMCDCPFALQLVKKLPRLQLLSYVSRERDENGGAVNPAFDPHDVDEYDDRFAFVRTNHDLTAFCRVVSRKTSMLVDVDIDLQGTENESFPALARLLHVSRGKLALHLGRLRQASSAHLVSGMETLSPTLNDLHLVFDYCQLLDQDYADILRPLESNRTLLSLVFECMREVGTNMDRTRAAIHDLVQRNTSIETLGFGASGPQVIASVMEAMIPALKSTNRSIRTLTVNTIGNGLSEVWESRLQPLMLDMLKSNCSVSHLDGLDLPDNDPVAFLVEQNRYGRRFLMGGGGSHGSGSTSSTLSSSCPRGFWATILGNVSRDNALDVMYAFLRSKPDLVAVETFPASAVSAARGGSGGSGRRRTKGRKRGRGAM